MRPEAVELGADLVREHPQVAGVETDGAERRPRGGDRPLDAAMDVVGVDEQCGPDTV